MKRGEYRGKKSPAKPRPGNKWVEERKHNQYFRLREKDIDNKQFIQIDARVCT